MTLRRQSIASALQLNKPDELLLTTYSLDEGELYSLGRHLQLDRSRVTVRFDPAAFRGWGPSRIIPPRWFKPFQPPRGSASLRNRLPPIYHPKVTLARRGESYRLIISTANLATADQQTVANLLCPVDLSPKRAKEARNWIRKATPARTMVVVAKDGQRQPKVIITDRPTWEIFESYRDVREDTREWWLLTAPFWHTEALRLLARDHQSLVRVDACFRDRRQATKVASPVMHKKVRCFVPWGGEPFHQKVIAWKGQTGGKTTVLLYIGSANLTPSGFLGFRGTQGRIAWNWEAGLLLVGNETLWGAAKRAAGAGVRRWRPLSIKGGKPTIGEEEIGPESEQDIDLENRLRVHLRTAIGLKGRTIRRRKAPNLPEASLEKLRVDVDDKDRMLKVGRRYTVPGNAKRVHIQGTYRIAAGGHRVVKIELPSLSAPVEARDLAPSLEALLAMLTPVSLASPVPGQSEVAADPGVSGVRPGWTDVRFPYSQLISRYRNAPKAALTWLQNVQQFGHKLPGFWKEATRTLNRLLPDAKIRR